MRTPLYTECATLLARADVRQAGFARLAGVTPGQVNNWCRGHAPMDRPPRHRAPIAAKAAESPPSHFPTARPSFVQFAPCGPGRRPPAIPPAPSSGGSGPRRAAATETTLPARGRTYGDRPESSKPAPPEPVSVCWAVSLECGARLPHGPQRSPDPSQTARPPQNLCGARRIPRTRRPVEVIRLRERCDSVHRLG
jgi:hypothetical protein